MNTAVKVKQLSLMAGDIIVLYLALILTLVIRYGYPFPGDVWSIHFEPFTYTFIAWIAIFYIAGLYELRHLKNNIGFFKKIGTAMVINAFIAIAIFYFTPVIIAPKTNLFILLIFVFLVELGWRRLYNSFLAGGAPVTKLLLIGNSETVKEIAEQVKQNPQWGYQISAWLTGGLSDKEIEHLNQIIISERVDLIVIPDHVKKNSRAARTIYRNLALGIEVIDVASFYESVFSKVPLSDLEEVWFLENLVNRHRIYEVIRQPLEIVLAMLLIVVLMPLAIVIALLIKLTSAGPVFYRQKRVGQHEAIFTLYKFRTMVRDAEKSGAQWAQQKDARVTSIGRILRRSHLDELPQLINIVKGDLSFVGPRPERPEFTEGLKEIIPFYELRHLIRPGITGWAQLNFRYGASVEDAREKLQYEIYYLKNRSLWLDIGIVIKTIRLFFSQN